MLNVVHLARWQVHRVLFKIVKNFGEFQLIVCVSVFRPATAPVLPAGGMFVENVI